MAATSTKPKLRVEPRWPAMLALLAIGGLRFALPESLSYGPDWLLLVVLLVLTIPIAFAHRRGLNTLNRILGILVTSIVTLDMVWSLGLLVASLPAHKQALSSCSSLRPRSGSPTSSSSPPGTGAWTEADPRRVNCAAFTPTVPSFFRR